MSSSYVKTELDEAVFRTAKMITPVRLQHPSQSYAEFINGDNSETREAWTVYTDRGIRNVSHVTRESVEETDMIIEELGEVIRRMAGKDAISQHPELETELKQPCYIDPHTPGRFNNLDHQKYGQYDMEDLSFNLTPWRSSFIEQYKSGIGANMYTDLVAYLDNRCCNAYGCYYRLYYPEFQVVGPAALPDTVKMLLVDVLPNCPTDNRVKNTLMTLHQSISDKKGAVFKARAQCIVCTLLNHSTQEYTKNGGIDHVASAENVVLINTGNLATLGMIEINRPDFMSCVAGVDEQTKVITTKWLDFRAVYKGHKEPDGLWVIIKVN